MNVSSRILGILRMVRIVAVLDCDGWHDAAGVFAVGAGSGYTLWARYSSSSSTSGNVGNW